MDFWLVLSKNDSNNICSSIKNESFLKIWRVWHILKVCHALWYLKIEMGIAGSIFELHLPNFQKMCIFWRFTNDISTILCYSLWFQFWKKWHLIPVHPRVVPALCNQLQRPLSPFRGRNALQKQWELVDWMNFFASSFDSFTLTTSCFYWLFAIKCCWHVFHLLCRILQILILM